MKSIYSARFLTIALLGLLTAAAGCEREGPAERAGEQVDRGVERAGEAAEEAGEKARESVDR